MAACGGLGAVARYTVDAVVTARAKRSFPWGILVVNLSGSFALGLLVGAAVHADLLFVAGTGFLGGYTTFSTWMVQTELLGDAGRRDLLMLNWVGSMALGLAAASVGWGIGAAL
jgi:CrcB protein